MKQTSSIMWGYVTALHASIVAGEVTMSRLGPEKEEEVIKFCNKKKSRSYYGYKNIFKTFIFNDLGFMIEIYQSHAIPL